MRGSAQPFCRLDAGKDGRLIGLIYDLAYFWGGIDPGIVLNTPIGELMVWSQQADRIVRERAKRQEG